MLVYRHALIWCLRRRHFQPILHCSKTGRVLSDIQRVQTASQQRLMAGDHRLSHVLDLVKDAQSPCHWPIDRSCARDERRLSFCCRKRPCYTSAADATWSNRGRIMCSHVLRILVQVADLHSRAGLRALVQQVQAGWLRSCGAGAGRS